MESGVDGKQISTAMTSANFYRARHLVWRIMPIRRVLNARVKVRRDAYKEPMPFLIWIRLGDDLACCEHVLVSRDELQLQIRSLLGRMGLLVDVVGHLVLNIVSSGRHYQSISSRLCVSELWSLSSSYWTNVESDIPSHPTDCMLNSSSVIVRIAQKNSMTLAIFPSTPSCVRMDSVWCNKRSECLQPRIVVLKVSLC